MTTEAVVFADEMDPPEIGRHLPDGYGTCLTEPEEDPPSLEEVRAFEAERAVEVARYWEGRWE